MNTSKSKETRMRSSPRRASALGATFLVLLASTAPALQAAPAPIAVNCAGNNPLQAAIDKAPAGATLAITGTCVGQFTIKDKSLVLQGKGTAAILFGGALGTVLTVLHPNTKLQAPFITIKDLTITGGDAESCGGGIRNGDDRSCQTFGRNPTTVRGGAIMLSNVMVTGNRAAIGAGIHNSSGTISLYNSKVMGNTGRGDYDILGAGIANAGTAYLINTIVAGNFTDSGSLSDSGSFSNPGSFTFPGSLFTDPGNSSVPGGFTDTTITVAGGGIWNSGNLNLTNSTVAGNTSQEGGGIYKEGGTVTLLSSVVTGNRASTGGGIWTLEGGKLTLGAAKGSTVGSTVTGNIADSDGGGIYNYGTDIIIDKYSAVIGNYPN
jgi:hypothetical protein